MNTFRKYISQVVGEDEDQMDIDCLDFTERYLSQFGSIERNTIEALVENGYQTKEALLAFDLKEDLPLLPDVNMAQKSILRKILQKFITEEELEAKVNDIKGVDEEMAVSSNQLKRKRESINESPVLYQKRTRNSGFTPEYRSVTPSVGSRMQTLVNKRQSMRGSAKNYETEVKQNLFEFSNNSRDYSLKREPIHANDTFSKGSDFDDNEESEEEVEQKPFLKKTRVSRVNSSRNSYASPTVQSLDSQTSRRTSQLNDSQIRRSLRSPTTSSPTEQTQVKTYIPTPTELEVRERLAKKTTEKGKRGRKRK